MLPAAVTFMRTMQILGSIFGSLVYAGLIPGLRIGATYLTGETAPGCFGPAAGVHNAELFWWEVRVCWVLQRTST
jgi:hypothetical protein